MAVEKPPLSRKRRTRAPIGYLVTGALCLDCHDPSAPERAHVQIEEIVEGDDAGRPFRCYRCGAELKPQPGLES